MRVRYLLRHRFSILGLVLATLILIWTNQTDFSLSDVLDNIRYSTGKYMQDFDIINYEEFEINRTTLNRLTVNGTTVDTYPSYIYEEKMDSDSIQTMSDYLSTDSNTTLRPNKGQNHTEVLLQTGSSNCTASLYNHQRLLSAPYKVYIYDLPLAFNADLIKCVADRRIAENDHCGFGALMYEQGTDMSVRNTWQFSLDVILHHKLMFSPYRTYDPEKADVFYIPFYEAMHCFCKGRDSNLTYNGHHYERAVHEEIQRLPYYNQQRPHVITIAKIEREERSSRCRLLTEKWLKDNLLLLGIEAYDKYRHKALLSNRFFPFKAVPYPSYGHFLNSGDGGVYREDMFQNRNVMIFLAAGSRRSNPFRNKILDQMTNRTNLSIKDYYSANAFSSDTKITQMWLLTPENIGPHQEATMKWMRNSLFCLQPAGDSPTRKSFYDAIVSGCIPVLFKIPYEPYVTYPFQDVINYSRFTITVGVNQTFMEVLQPYLDNISLLKPFQVYLQKIMQYFQYSYPIDNKPHTDTMKLIMDQIGKHFGLQKNITSFWE